jgi:hypothetical protein
MAEQEVYDVPFNHVLHGYKLAQIINAPQAKNTFSGSSVRNHKHQLKTLPQYVTDDQ